MRVKFTRKPDAEARANGRRLDPTTVMLHADGRLLQAPRMMGVTSYLPIEDVTDLFDVEPVDVEPVEEWQVVLTKTQLDVVRSDLKNTIAHCLREAERCQYAVYQDLAAAFGKARRVE